MEPSTPAVDPLSFARTHLRPAQKIVLQLLQDLNWEASQNQIAQETKLTTQSVNAIIQELVAAGILSRLRSGAAGPSPTRYTFHPERLFTTDSSVA
jgi:DNA-binding MarR family transcriptional regulator